MVSLWTLNPTIRVRISVEPYFLFQIHFAIADLYCSGWYMDMVTSAAQFHLEMAALKMKQLKAMYILGQK